jgi:hypothetical protein
VLRVRAGEALQVAGHGREQLAQLGHLAGLAVQSAL